MIMPPKGKEGTPGSSEGFQRIKSPLLDGSGAVVGTRTRYIVDVPTGRRTLGFSLLSEEESTRLRAMTTLYEGIFNNDELKNTLSNRIYWRARADRRKTDPIVLPDGREVLLTDPRISQLYVRDLFGVYDYVLDVAANRDTFRYDYEMKDRTIDQVPAQYLETVASHAHPSQYVMMNINPFTLTVPGDQTIDGVMFTRVRDVQKPTLQVAAQLLGKEGLLVIDALGKPYLRYP